MIWKECLPQQDEFRQFRVVESEEDRCTICLVDDTEYPPISIICRAARGLATSHLPIVLPSVTGHPIRIHSRTTVCLKFDKTEDAGLGISVRRHAIPSFMIHVNRLRIHLWCFLEAYISPSCWRRIIEACPNLTSITAFRSPARSRRGCRFDKHSFANFLAVQRDTKRWSPVKPEFWLYGVSTTLKIDGVGEDGQNTVTDAIVDVLHQFATEKSAVLQTNCSVS
jgi:hypothetical protein